MVVFSKEWSTVKLQTVKTDTFTSWKIVHGRNGSGIENWFTGVDLSTD